MQDRGLTFANGSFGSPARPGWLSRLGWWLRPAPVASDATRPQHREWEIICYLLFSVLCLTTGCAFDKDVSKYRAVLDGNRPTTLPAYDPDQPLTVVRALQLANADDEAIGITGENYIQALAQKMKDAGNFLPTLGIAPSYSLAKGGSSAGFTIGGTTTGTGGTTTGSGGTTGTGGTGATSVVIGSSSGGLSHDFSVPLGTSLTGSLTNVSTLEAQGVTVNQQALLLLNEREAILLQVVQSYYTCLKDERQVAVYESSVKFKAEKVRDQLARLKLGAVKPLDLATSQSDLASTRVSLIQARTDALNARSALARLMGVSEVRGELIDSFVPPPATVGLTQWQVDAKQHRQDLLAAMRATEAARLRVDAAIREYFPSVTINFNYFLYNDPISSQIWTAGVTGNIPIFSALSIEGDVRNAWSVYRQTALTESQTRRQVTDDVNEGFANLQNSRDKIHELTIEVSAAQKAADLAERSYQLGSESNLDRLTQQDNLLTAQLNLVSEEFNEKSNYLNLLRDSGVLATVLK
jgi:outer membrane protein TolC